MFVTRSRFFPPANVLIFMVCVGKDKFVSMKLDDWDGTHRPVVLFVMNDSALIAEELPSLVPVTPAL